MQPGDMAVSGGHIVKKPANNIAARDDGHFQFREHKFVEADQYSGPHWEPGWVSGIYLSADLAEREALAQLPWLRDEISN